MFFFCFFFCFFCFVFYIQKIHIIVYFVITAAGFKSLCGDRKTSLGIHVCWSEHSDSSFVYEFMSLDYGFGTMTATTWYFSIVMIQ